MTTTILKIKEDLWLSLLTNADCFYQTLASAQFQQ